MMPHWAFVDLCYLWLMRSCSQSSNIFMYAVILDAAPAYCSLLVNLVIVF